MILLQKKFIIILILISSCFISYCEIREYPHYIRAEVEFAVILDNTATMGPFWGPAKEALHSLVDSLKEGDRMQFIVSASGSPFIWEEFLENKDAIHDSIDELVHASGLHDERYDLAVKLAVNNFSSGKLGCILLIGDGYIHSFYDPDVTVLYDSIESHTEKKAAVYPIVFEDIPGNIGVLDKIAEAGNGEVIYLTHPSDLGDEYERIKVEALKHMYD